MLKYQKRLALFSVVGALSVLFALIGGFYVIARRAAEDRVMGRFEFEVNDPQTSLTEEEAVRLAQASMTRLGLDVTLMRIEDAADGTRLSRNTLDPGDGAVDFRGPPPKYVEYIVDLEKTTATIKTTVVLGK